MPNPQRSILGIVFLTVFLDMVGFSIIFPLFPAVMQHYVGREGPESLIQQLVVALEGVSDNQFAVVALFGGALGSIYSVLQFLFAPIWGALSDRWGRRPILLVTLAGTALSYVLWFVSGTFVVLIVARLVGGIMAGNISTASAVVADTSRGSDRAKGMGILGAGIGLGFIVGPVIGGLTASWDLREVWPAGEDIGVNPFSGCALIAFCLAAVNFLAVLRRLSETLPETISGIDDEPTSQETGRRWNPFQALARLSFPGVKQTNISYFIYLAAFAAMEFTLTFLAFDRLGYKPRDNMWMFVFVGVIIALVQGGVVRRLAPKLGERKLASSGISLTIPGFVLVGWAQSSGVLYLGLACLAVGSALVMPCLSALVSRYTPDDRQGLALGVFRSMGSLARALGPVLGGLLYWGMGSWAPYYVGAVVLAVPLIIASRLPAVDEDT